MDRIAPLAWLAAPLAAAWLAAPACAAGLEAYQGKSRPVVVFAPDREFPAAADQLKRLAGAREALTEREMPVFVVTARGVTTLSGGRSPATLTATDLRQAYGVTGDDFTIVLVGKDGGEKLRSAEPVDAQKLTDLVDEMPMRRNETR